MGPPGALALSPPASSPARSAGASFFAQPSNSKKISVRIARARTLHRPGWPRRGSPLATSHAPPRSAPDRARRRADPPRARSPPPSDGPARAAAAGAPAAAGRMTRRARLLQPKQSAPLGLVGGLRRRQALHVPLGGRAHALVHQ